MITLNEDCLRHIFHYLQPHDWIHTSQVCSLWRAATLTLFQQITNISRWKQATNARNYVRITLTEAKKIIQFAAPFIKVLDLHGLIILGPYFNFGQFLYYAEDLDEDAILKILLAESDTELTEVHFYNLPKKELSKILFSRNKIRKVEFSKSGDIYPEIPTDGIEELKVYFNDVYPVSSFKNLFPNLKRLELHLQYCSRAAIDSEKGCKTVLLQILPYVLGIKSFHLQIHSQFLCEAFFEILLGITKLPQLEELSIDRADRALRPMDGRFLKQLARDCSKLQILKFRGIMMQDEKIQETLLMPNLKSLDINAVISFGLTELPLDIKNLSELRMEIDYPTDINFMNLSRFLKHLPGLKILQLSGIEFLQDIPHINQDHIIELVCGAVVAVASEEKYIVVEDGCRLGNPPMQLRIARNNVDFLESQKLVFTIRSFYLSAHPTFIYNATMFLQSKGHTNYVFILEDLETR